jgi:hypothetical protein
MRRRAPHSRRANESLEGVAPATTPESVHHRSPGHRELEPAALRPRLMSPQGPGPWWKRLAPGMFFIAEYGSNGRPHEWLALWPLSDTEWWVRQPDGSEYGADLQDGEVGRASVSLRPWLDVPAGRMRGLTPVDHFKKRPTLNQIKSAISRGLYTVCDFEPLERTPLVHTVVIGGETVSLERAFGDTGSPLMLQAIARFRASYQSSGEERSDRRTPPASRERLRSFVRSVHVARPDDAFARSGKPAAAASTYRVRPRGGETQRTGASMARAARAAAPWAGRLLARRRESCWSRSPGDGEA